jgi:hypothetical protein
MRAALLLLTASACFAQLAPDPNDVLSRARVRLAAAAAAVPKYTCTETVDRNYFHETRQAPQSCDNTVANHRSGRIKLVLSATDRLRFDVEVADGGYEIYAWPGASRIANEKIEDMAGGGPLGTGPFEPFLVDIFANNAVQFQYLGEKSGLLGYRYRVPLEASHYRVQAGLTWSFTAYDGTFRLDPTSAELKQLTVRTAELPSKTGSCEATTLMDFESLRIGAGEYLIPRQTHLQVIGRDATFTENGVAYTSCHEFHAESEIRFDAPAPEASQGMTLASSLHGPTLPPGLPVVLRLDTEIDTDLAAAGDLVAAEIVKPLLDPKTHQVLMEAGTVIRGRINHLEHKIEGEKYFLIGLSFDTLPIVLDEPRQTKDPRAANIQVKVDGYQQGPIDRRSASVSTESRTRLQGGGTLIFPTRESKYIVPRGYISDWITLPGK